MNYKTRTILLRVIIYTFLALMLVVTIVPIYILMVNATRSTYEIQQGVSLLPSTHMIDNYNILVGRGMNLWQGFGNSLFLSVCMTFVGVYFAFLTAYGVSVYEFKGKTQLYNFILVLVMIPMQLSIIGFYQYMSKLGLVDNYLSMILPMLANAGGVFFAKQYLDSVLIRDLIDAARIDGCGELRIFHDIMLPIAAPGAFTLAIFTFVASWNNFFNAYILINSREKYTLPMLVQTLRGDVYRTEYGSIYLGLAITVVPILVIYALFSRYIISGIAMGSLKE
ncbi:MAG: carbohydrate ABC transporter permease [Anaerolineaceae bacterium]|nr:carbohydrate ABC transporter permease [Anaerolineaceae bacterium]